MSSEIAKIAEAETLIIVEGNMCGVAMRDADAPPESQTTSRRKGMRRNLGGLTRGRGGICRDLSVRRRRAKMRRPHRTLPRKTPGPPVPRDHR